MVQHEVHAHAGFGAKRCVANVALVELQARPLRGEDGALDVVQVAPVAGREVIQADHALIQPQELLEQVRADKASHAGDQPALRLGTELLAG